MLEVSVVGDIGRRVVWSGYLEGVDRIFGLLVSPLCNGVNASEASQLIPLLFTMYNKRRTQ